jgi:hypothetical protein
MKRFFLALHRESPQSVEVRIDIVGIFDFKAPSHRA